MFKHPQDRRNPQSSPTDPSEHGEHRFNPRSSSLPRFPTAIPRPLNLNRGIQPTQPLYAAAATTPPYPSPTTPLSTSSRSLTPPNAHPLGPPTLLGIPRPLRERIYAHLLLRRRRRGTPPIPYTTSTFPLGLLLAGSELLMRECRDFAIVNNTFNIVLNGGGMHPGYVFRPTAVSPRHPPEGWIRRMCVHMHVDLNGLFVYPGAAVLAAEETEGGKIPGVVVGCKQLVRAMRHNGMPSLEVVDLWVVEVIPERRRIFPTCGINERDVRARYRALVEILLGDVKKEVVVRWRGVECVYVPEMGERVWRGGEGWDDEGEESSGEESGVEYSGGRGRRQGSEQARVRAREGGGWERAEDYDILSTEMVMEVGKRERGRRFVDVSAVGMGEGEGYGARELFGVMMRVDQLPAGVVEGEEVEEEEEEEEGQGGVAVPEKGKRKGLMGIVSQSRLALRLSAGEKEKEKEKTKEEEKAIKEAERLQEKLEKEQEKEAKEQEKGAKERQKEKEKLEREREKQRAKAKKEQDKSEKKAEKRRSEGSKGVETQEQKEGLKDRIKWFGPKKDGDEKEPRNSTW
ncbi:MAG: hypothetical protein OHK93_002800 [Ramalina farinacea]|uniref:Uncharacterized protein n=1 Tax=Ramalina farinacea TaxID=258253 RepID=A0AA43QUQ6_9LECA|nr:hypothetical protein [Ramalina farinacea]